MITTSDLVWNHGFDLRVGRFNAGTWAAPEPVVSGTMGYILNMTPAPGALALLGMAGLGRRKRS